jgi:hypothetical protein
VLGVRDPTRPRERDGRPPRPRCAPHESGLSAQVGAMTPTSALNRARRPAPSSPTRHSSPQRARARCAAWS